MASSQNSDLVEIKGLRSSQGYFMEKKFLSVEETYDHLQKKPRHESGEKMKKKIYFLRSDLFLRLPVEFPVTGLQHSTTLDSMEDILESQSFIGRNAKTAPGESELRADFMDLSFWAADISSIDIEKAREAAYTYVLERCPGKAENYREEIMQQFANSPAFNKSASRYGNFSFSLPFSDLLSLYGDQFCNGEKPQLSILGTDIYKLEIVHYVVVHSPDEKHFIRITKVQDREQSLPFVYWMGDTLYWRPQSTSDRLKVLSKKGEITRCPVREVGEKIYDEELCMWNLLTFAFYIPRGRALKIPVKTLTDNLSACDDLNPYMKAETIPKLTAETHVEKVKQQYEVAKESNQKE